MPIEIDEEEYNRLKGVADLAARIHANPNGRRLLEQAHRTINPKAAAPTLDQEAVIAEPVNAVQKQLANLTELVTKKFADDDTNMKLSALTRQQNEGFDRLRQGGYRDEGIEAIQKIMSDKGILDPEIAAAYFEKINPPQIATPTGSGSINFVEAFNDESDKNLQALLQSRGDSEQALNSLVQGALSDFRKTSPARR